MSPEPRDVPAATAATSVADRYVLEELLARGGMGSVYRARDEVLARAVAVKILHPHLSRDEAFLARFRREAVAAAGLSHPSIVAIYDTGSDRSEDGDERHFIVMEHCAGGTLTELVAASGPPAPERAAGIGAAICAALDFAHRAGVVHRDVKPDNVLFSDDGTLKVADFGIAKAAYASDDITTTGSILGTVTYISPEQAAGREPDPRSDVYSTGVLLYELLTGRPPFSGETDVATALMHLKETPVPVRALRPQVPRALEAAVMRALAKDPAERWASADDLCRALDGAPASSRSTTVMSRPVTGGPAPDEPVADTHRSDIRWVGPVFALILFAILLAFVVPRLLDTGGDRAGRGGGDRRGAPGAAGSPVAVSEVQSFDPDGDGEEHSEEASLAADGDPATTWGSEIYDDALAILGKDGIGLVFDLGRPVAIESVEVDTTTPGLSFEIRAGNAFPATEEDAAVVGSARSAAASEQVSAGGVSRRYWVLWVTELPEGAGAVEIAEVVFRGRS
jgi:hypothetical protein